MTRYLFGAENFLAVLDFKTRKAAAEERPGPIRAIASNLVTTALSVGGRAVAVR
jgi:hypothetical protein